MQSCNAAIISGASRLPCSNSPRPRLFSAWHPFWLPSRACCAPRRKVPLRISPLRVVASDFFGIYGGEVGAGNSRGDPPRQGEPIRADLRIYWGQRGCELDRVLLSN